MIKVFSLQPSPYLHVSDLPMPRDINLSSAWFHILCSSVHENIGRIYPIIFWDAHICIDICISVTLSFQYTFIQTSAVITQSKILWYCMHDCRNWDRISIDAESTKDTPYLALTGELLGVICKYCEKIDRVLLAPHCIRKSDDYAYVAWDCKCTWLNQNTIWVVQIKQRKIKYFHI